MHSPADHKPSDYDDHIHQLALRVQKLPSHDAQDQGWWCAHPRLMIQLLPLLALPFQFDFPSASTFRDDVAQQLALCRKCTYNYHRAVSQWQHSASKDPPEACVTQQKLTALTEWDVTRLIQPMTKQTTSSSSSLQLAQVVAVRKNRCKEAFLEALQSHRICAHPLLSAQLAELFKRSTPVRNKEDMEPYLKFIGQIPAGLQTLCFDNSIAVRVWATRVVATFSRKFRANTRALHFLVREAARQISIQPDEIVPTGGSGFFSMRETKALWEGFGTLICSMQDDSVLLFVERNRISVLVNPIFLSLHSSQNYIVATAADCLYRLLGAVPFEQLFVEGVMPLDAVLDILIHSFKKDGRELSTMHRLLDLFAPVLASAKKSGQTCVSKLFQKCFDFLYAYCASGMSDGKLTIVGTSNEAETELLRAVMKTGTSLLNWFYSHCAPNLPFEDTQKIATFIVTVLREHPSERGWDLLRTALLTDVFNIIRCLKDESDVKVIGDTFLTKRPLNIALRPEEETIMENVVNPGGQNGNKRLITPVMTWVKELWKQIRLGKHVEVADQAQDMMSRNHEEMKIMLDLHRLVGMVDISACLSAPSTPANAADQKTFDRKAIRQLISEVQDTIFARLIAACESSGEQTWWQQLPFHSTHLLSSSRKDVANMTFEALLKSKKLRDASCAGSHSKLLAHVLKNDSVAAEMMADGCVSCLRMIAALGSSVSLRTYPCFLLWYRVLLESRYVTLLESKNSRASSWALALILNFITAWKVSEQTASASVFAEVCCRFLSNLREVWKRFYKLVDPVGGKAMSQVMLEKVIIGLFGMNELQNPITRAAWVHTICSVGYTWKDQQVYRTKMTKIVSEHAKRRNLLSLEQCKKLADALDLHQVQDLLTKWSTDERNKSSIRNSNSAKRETTIDQFFGTKNPVANLQAEIAGASKKFSTKSIASHTPGIMKPALQWERMPKPLLKQNSLMQKLRNETRNMTKSVRRTTGVKRNPDIREKKEPEKTRHQRGVEQRIAEKDRRLAESTLEDGLPSQSSKSALPRMAAEEVLARSVQKSGPERIMQRAESRTRDDGRGLDERFILPAHRRRMESRSIDQVHRALLSMKISPEFRREKFGKLIGTAPSRFTDVEDYIQHWEPIIISEFRAEILRCVDEELTFAAQEKTAGGYRSCRALFEVETPVETVGHLQNLTLRDANEKPNDYVRSGLQSRDNDFSVGNLQSLDLVLLEIAPARPETGEDEGENMSYSLGLVSSTARKKGVLSVKVNVAFEGLSVVPGKGRQVRVSKLTSVSTFQRQIDGLWSAAAFPNEILWILLDPKEGWRVSKYVREYARAPFARYIDPQLGFIERMRNNETLNGSQSDAVEEVVRACASLFQWQHKRDGQIWSRMHSSITLVQGPPGTGKTSTIVAMLSTLLFQAMEIPKWRKARIRTENGPVRVPLAPIRILVCAPSNAAVDELMLRVMEKGLLTSSGAYAVPRLVRVGGGTTLETIKKLELNALADIEAKNDRAVRNSSQVLRNCFTELSDLNTKISAADKERKELIGKHGAEASLQEGASESAGGKRFRELTTLLSTLHDRKRQVNATLNQERVTSREDEDARKQESSRIKCAILNSSSIVFCTLNSAGHEVFKKLSANFDVIVVDESAQCGEPEALIPISNAQVDSEKSSHVVLVGDPKQLPATVISAIPEVKAALGKSLFERVNEEPQSDLHILTTQYRMHPDICAFPNNHFYDGQLANGPNLTTEASYQSFHDDPTKRFGPLSFLDTSQCRGTHEIRGSGGSLYNRGEAQLITAAVISLIRLYGSNGELNGKIVILSPYRQQVSILKKMVNEKVELFTANVEVSTIDGIQGREKSVVLLSTVRNSSGSGIGFVDDSRRMNVAITRAKHSLIIVGHGNTLGRYSELWSSLLTHCKRSNTIFSIHDPITFFPESRPGLTVKPAQRISPSYGIQKYKREPVAVAPHGKKQTREEPRRSNQTVQGNEVSREVSQAPKPVLRSVIPSSQANYPTRIPQENTQEKDSIAPPEGKYSTLSPSENEARPDVDRFRSGSERRIPLDYGNEDPQANFNPGRKGANKKRRVRRRRVPPNGKQQRNPAFESMPPPRRDSPPYGRPGPSAASPRGYVPLPGDHNHSRAPRFSVQPSPAGKNFEQMQQHNLPQSSNRAPPANHSAQPRQGTQAKSRNFNRQRAPPNHAIPPQRFPERRQASFGKAERAEERERLLTHHRNNNKRPRQEANNTEQRFGNGGRTHRGKRNGKKRRVDNGARSRPTQAFSLTQSQEQLRETRERVKRASNP